MSEYTSVLADEEDKAKQLAKTKAKQEAIIQDYEDQIKQGEKVSAALKFSLLIEIFDFAS